MSIKTRIQKLEEQAPDIDPDEVIRVVIGDVEPPEDEEPIIARMTVPAKALRRPE